MDNRILFPAKVINVDDPLMIGRIRAEIDSDRNIDIYSAITDPPFNPLTDIWGDRDPFVFKPLLPYYILQTPKEGERVLIIFSNKDYKFDNQYYIQSDFSSPMRVDGSSDVESRITTGSGRRFKRNLNLKNLDGSYRKESTRGIFPEPGDNAILGRGTSDIIVKKDEILIRSGKVEGELAPNITPIQNKKRSFIQVSQFKSRKKKVGTSEIQVENTRDLKTKHLIEWSIQNPDGNVFNGFVNLYQLRDDDRVGISQLNENSVIEDIKFLKVRATFSNLEKKEAIDFINNFISDCNSKTVLESGVVLFTNEIRFPIFYRPALANRLRLGGSLGGLTKPQNLIDIYNEIKFDKFSKIGGSGFIYSKNNTTPPTKVDVGTFDRIEYINELSSATLIGGDEIYLLAHDTNTSPNKQKIDLNNTLYGISNDKIVDDIEPNTSSMVRGEELLELINIIVRFLITHAHPFPGLPPVSVTEDGSTIQNLLNELSLATTKILNKKIKVN